MGVKIGDRVETEPVDQWSDKIIHGVVEKVHTDGLLRINVTTPGYTAKTILRHPYQVTVPTRSREERIAEQAALVAEKERVLKETQASLEAARGLLAELSKPEPPKVNQIWSGRNDEKLWRVVVIDGDYLWCRPINSPDPAFGWTGFIDVFIKYWTLKSDAS